MNETALEQRKQSHLHQDLEAVANTDNQFSSGDEFFEGPLQTESEPIGKNLPRGDIVSEGKPTGNREDVMLVQKRRGVDQVVYMDAIRLCARTPKRIGGFQIAIDSQSGKNERSNVHL